jgi:hypothetical protein
MLFIYFFADPILCQGNDLEESVIPLVSGIESNAYSTQDIPISQAEKLNNLISLRDSDGQKADRAGQEYSY